MGRKLKEAALYLDGEEDRERKGWGGNRYLHGEQHLSADRHSNQPGSRKAKENMRVWRGSDGCCGRCTGRHKRGHLADAGLATLVVLHLPTSPLPYKKNNQKLPPTPPASPFLFGPRTWKGHGSRVSRIFFS